MSNTDVLIIGGGWAGLWAACALARDGLAVRLLERREILGGRATTDGADGFRLNLGPHALYRQGAARAALAELGIEPKGGLPPTDGARALIGDDAPSLPVGPLSFLTTELLDGGARWALVRALNRTLRADVEPLRGQPIGPWLDAQITNARARQVVSTLLRVTTYTDDEAHLDAAEALLQLRRGLRGNVLYLDGGWATVVEALRDGAIAAGADLRVGVTAQSITRTMHGLEVATSAGPLQARAIIVATPPDTAGKLIPTLALDGLRPVRAAVLDVALSRLPQPSNTLALGVDRPLYFSVHSAVAKLAPSGGAVVHVARYGGAGPRGEAELEAVLDRLQPGWRDHVVERRYLPRLTVFHGLPVAGQARPADSGVDGVFIAGDWVGPEGFLADTALASARVAVNQVRARLTQRGMLVA